MKSNIGKRKKRYYTNQEIFEIQLKEGFTFIKDERIFLDDIFRILSAFCTCYAIFPPSKKKILLKKECFICHKKIDSGYHVKKKLSLITQNICYICWKSNLSPKL
jgi:hypothetical protein